MNRRYVRARSVADRVVAAVLLVPALPVMAVIALTIAVRMGRPVLFRQQRIGMGGRSFEILKFRTMVPDAERIGGGYFPDGLDLVPPLGRFLRRSSLDELPQLLNVVRGDMAFIGPRPALVSQFARYTPEQKRRVSVPQGITGLAQVVYRNDAPWSKRIELDVHYAEHIGLRMDARVLALTVRGLLTASGVVEGQTAADVDDLAPPADTGIPTERGELS
ncbi:sugar transferase [Leifsonia sp. NPDC080035]|uniref:Sugar transferase n=1 Tax=Leifsonia sp. NPDC080035 TaxID=3143936 RepID=A0AAU7GFK7_9MICO